MTYTHRNGETDPPQTDGWYWIKGVRHGREDIRKLHWWVSSSHRYLYYENDDGLEFNVPDDSGDDYQWWGPIVPPWDESA